ncbi:hypothetical protein JDV02_003370 [Purpureocillium takamizusanense]|uniref:Uncharacterized protein n=1 Tax=Purpureocillium takamizusanense TaxID=2060973 RepID=A0A9Q8QBG4_9HYPO|nr:uncharacterized protein JDV02_003370 [Purpureocillium takamizusanense]UNI16988.1 hypothetical protein JDV02_003370 [Purpureocillium takamizusanense]
MSAYPEFTGGYQTCEHSLQKFKTQKAAKAYMAENGLGRQEYGHCTAENQMCTLINYVLAATEPDLEHLAKTWTIKQALVTIQCYTNTPVSQVLS